MLEYKDCIRCGEPFLERGIAKKYCSGKCKNADHMTRKRAKEKVFVEVEKILRKNHRILEKLMDQDRKINLSELEYFGFNPIFHTARKKYKGSPISIYYNIGVLFNSDQTIKIIRPNEL